MKWIRNERLRIGLKIALLAIYVFYAGSISFFTHTHIINGVTIVHSHPFQSDSDGKPTHTHNGAEIQLIQNLSSYQSDGQILYTFLLGVFLTCIAILIGRIYTAKASVSYELQYRLRPPPVFC